jgi:hypothetical protein
MLREIVEPVVGYMGLSILLRERVVLRFRSYVVPMGGKEDEEK